ncbi:DNA polymerase iota-like [Hyperolius riggenbachi]|uniref:DNA polymerase iota-like n=1 Tax=Hyperolius riggenbachi TaxID=752182 RepID=UPI0035A36E72
MESPREEEEEETDWLSREEEDPYRVPILHSTACSTRKVVKCDSTIGRVIMHLDMDCFYAQVEMIRNPELRDKPLGVQQKNLLVTCNYEARRLGLNKCSSIREAKEICPQLVLVSGEDLTHYREMSYKVTELLEEISVKVERLGFDENFMDITELVDKKLQEADQQRGGGLDVVGHVYNNQTVDGSDGTHRRLVAGSHIAADIRAAVHSRLGLTGCAGIAGNKLLSKLVSGTFKPNQQTVLLPESSGLLINSLPHVGKIPGIGHRTAQRLEALGLDSVCALQACPVSVLEKELGASVAHRIQQLSRGEDDSPVTPTGPPQSLSEEDSFKKCSTVSDVKAKLEELLRSLLNRVQRDGRSPQTLRLTLRQSHPTNKYPNRESRQCPIPKNVIQNLSSELSVPVLMDLLMKLFEKMIDAKWPFHLTLLNVCFSNLKPAQCSGTARNSIGFYLTQKRIEASQMSQEPGTQAEKDSGVTDEKKPGIVSDRLESNHPAPPSLSDDIDMDVFSQLPEDIRREILSSPQTGGIQKSSQDKRPSPKGIQSFFMKASARHPQSSTAHNSACDIPPQSGQNKMAAVIAQLPVRPESHNGRDSGSSNSTGSASSSSYVLPSSSGCKTLVESQCCDTDPSTAMDCSESSETTDFFPKSVDMSVFSQLPEELRTELMTDWKHKKLTPKIPVKKSQEKVKNAKGQRPHPSAKPNNLLKYFKPG